MSFIINQNFDLKSPQFNFARDYYENLDALKAACGNNWNSYSSFPNHFITNVGGTLYQYTESNSKDANTGKWRKLEFGGTAGDIQALNTKIGNNASAIATNTTNISKNTDDIQVLNGNLANKVDKVTGKGLSTNDYTTAEKNKLAGIAQGANKTVVDTTFSNSSTNPVENRVIKTELDRFSTAVEQALNGKASKDVATTTANGLLSSADKLKLNNLAADANNSYVAKSEMQTLSDEEINTLWNEAK